MFPVFDLARRSMGFSECIMEWSKDPISMNWMIKVRLTQEDYQEGDIEIRIRNNTLVVIAKKVVEGGSSGGSTQSSSRAVHSNKKVVSLPEGLRPIKKIERTLDNGTLLVTLMENE
ncbi:unnamed protein product [Brassicogethes aeneus]|uniref:SHSP domain-containing protein n=1 Tax=Brassicogethes aeneus TaxID=1431903 RepID=A0A9P0AS62_BRAAE|nr:unnamed protein product [Brassicogethes aeneus]